MNYFSNLKLYIEELIEQKRATGYSYETSAWMLKYFDCFCRKYYPDETMLTNEIAMHWAQRRNDEHINSIHRRLTPVRQLAKYMNSIGIEAYVIPQGIPGKMTRYTPHIFTGKELSAFFSQIDKCKYCPQSPAMHLVIPTLFRVIYCCGLRSSEARLLKVDEVDLETGALTIRNYKGAKDRTVMLSEDVLKLCRLYHKKVDEIFPDRKWFFPNHRGDHYGDNSFMRIFHIFWEKTQITNISGNMPRVHDFRHAFALNRLNLWVREGKDLNAYLPYLSMYLGHADLSATDYYLHLIPDFFPVITERTEERFADLIPEV
ncbi:MAG: tyrosine-type recombinase/integrase [Candidatus Humimicrobiaceae bacterium]